MSSIYDWSTTAASNATADGGINWVEGQAPSTVNNSARQMMGRLAELIGDIGGSLTAGGTADALTVTANSAFTTYANGRLLAFTAASDNTTAATLNVNSTGAKSIRKMTTSGDSALSGAEIQAGGVYLVQYSTAANAAAGGWILVNPTIDMASFVTLTGSQTLTNKTLTSPTINGGSLNGTLGATTPSTIVATTISGTNGSFSGTMSVTGAVTLSNTLSATGSISSSGNLTAGGSIISTGRVFANDTAGTMSIRPSGVGSVTGQMTITSAGAVTINGTLTVTG